MSVPRELWCKSFPFRELLLWYVLNVYLMFRNSPFVLKEPKINKDEFMTPEELQRRKDMEEAARAWNEAILKTDSGSTTIKIKEACMIAPDDCISI